MLLSGAGLLVRSFSKLTALHTGMSVENMLVMKIGLGWREYQQTYPPSVYQEIIVRVQGVPGVRSAAPPDRSTPTRAGADTPEQEVGTTSHWRNRPPAAQ